MYIFITAADSCTRAVCQRRQLKIQICDHFSDPFRMCGKNLLVSSGRPVKVGINNAPFLCRHRTEHDRVVRLESAFNQRFCNAKHHGDCRIIILKSTEIGVIVCR